MKKVTRAADAAEPETLAELNKQYEAIRAKSLSIDLTRGLPSPEQLALSDPMLHITETHMDGIDCRNYGISEGLPSARKLFGEYLGVPAKNIFVLGNSSIELMHHVVSQAMIKPLPGARVAWGAMVSQTPGRFPDPIKPAILCPVPGFDRHFSICQRYGIETIPINLTDTGPDMNQVHRAVTESRVVGMWCMPKFSNPSAITYSPETVKELAEMEVANPGFRLLVDNAYAHHDLTDQPDGATSLFDACAEADNPGRLFMFGSTSKVTYAGAGVGMVAASVRNLGWFKEGLSVRVICPDKLNQLRHVQFLRDMEGIRAHMKKHRKLLAPKLRAVEKIFSEELPETHMIQWTKPKGGYFILLSVKGMATRTLELAAGLGVKLLEPKELYPTGNMPYTDLRIAPSFPPIDEVRTAAHVIALCVKIARLS